MLDDDAMRKLLKDAPYKLLAEEMARRNSNLRKAHEGGRPKKLQPCPYCGKEYGVRELREHKPECLWKP